MHTIELENGSRLAYRDRGQGPVMVLVHGWGVSGELFADQLQSLSGRFRLVVPDLPGHGGSDPFPVSGQFSELADAIAALIQKLQLQSVCLTGWSMGALVAWDLLQRYPRLDISALITVDMVPKLLSDDNWPYGLREGQDHHVFDRDMELMQADWPAFTDRFAARLISSKIEASGSKLLCRIKAVARTNQPDSMARIWKLMIEQDFRAALRDLQIPALVIACGQSALYGIAAGEWVAAQMPNARLEIFPDSGHAPHLDQPQHFNRLLAEFTETTITQPAGTRSTHGINTI